MSDTTVTTEAPRNEAGQFESSEPAYGREGLERAAGYVPMPDESKESPEDLTKDEAAQRLRELSGSESKIVTHTAGLPANMTMTVDQAADALKDARGADDAQAEIDDTKAAQKEIDKRRGDNPEAKQPPIETEDDIERALKSPKVQAAITERVTAANEQRERYESGVVEAGKVAIATIAADFPELANRPLTEWTATLQQMQVHEPARFQQAMARLHTVARVETAAKQMQADKTAREQSEFRDYATKEDARFAEMTKGERNMPAIESEIVAMVTAHGVDPREFFAAGNESKFLRSAAAQKILVDAAKYRIMQRAPKPVATRPVPPVVRPGMAGPRTNQEHNNLKTLTDRLSKSGSLKDAVALRVAQKKGR